MFRRKRFSPAVQDLFGGDGIVDDTGPMRLDEWEQLLRKSVDNLSTHFGGDEKKARRLFLESWPASDRRIFAAMLTRPPRPAGRPAGSKKWTPSKRASLEAAVRDIQRKHPKWKKNQISAELAKLQDRRTGGKRLSEKTIYGLLTKRPKK